MCFYPLPFFPTFVNSCNIYLVTFNEASFWDEGSGRCGICDEELATLESRLDSRAVSLGACQREGVHRCVAPRVTWIYSSPANILLPGEFTFLFAAKGQEEHAPDDSPSRAVLCSLYPYI